MNWVKALAKDELSQNSQTVVMVEGRTILLVHHAGQIYAMENACTHMKLPLKGGKIAADNAIVCPWHHSAFDLTTGQVKGWSLCPLEVRRVLVMVSKAKALPVFPTRLEDGNIWVEV